MTGEDTAVPGPPPDGPPPDGPPPDGPPANTPAGPVVGPLERGLAVLRATAAADEQRLRPSDLVHATGLARATVDRVVSTLLRLGLLRATGRDLVLSPGLMRFGNAYLAGSGTADALQPFAERLAGALDESVSVAVPDGDGVRFVAQVIRRRAMTPVFRIGDLLPADRCAAGLVTGPDAPDWAVDDQRLEPGLIAVAVPVTGPDGRRACGVSVVSTTGRHTAASLTATALPELRALLPEMTAALAAARSRPPRATAGARPLTPVAEAKRELGAGFLQSLARGLDVLAVLGTDPRGLTLSEAARAAGQPRATARRALLSLVQLGYVRHDERRFHLLPRVLELGYAHLSELDFTEIVQPHLRELTARVHESASVAVLDGREIRYVARVPAYRIMSVTITIGTRFPAAPTSLGRVLLAGLDPADRAALLSAGPLPRFTHRTVTDPAALGGILDAVAADGHALVDEELEEGLRSLAVPVPGPDGRTVAALNVSTHTGRGTAEESRAGLLPALRETAARIGEDLAVAFERRPLRLP
ncbi:IclR family transcriptional regulator domain-containing protein [Streptomyces zingiberis]|uniref:Helix-turn-helix domain-containing protein n=1 Tax=Streptomyces zingiberis TaxID=2053010 RepID=A0ABX1BZM0_9ACTN|nr:IclR family transcriptional regulator C-terminal domain-containing protein [Streptomyces zingiberis]NJQ00109.1 helix-turn-helix domain-containing protein [Streptomyces zingiberis]